MTAASFDRELEHLRRIRLENRWSYRALSDEIFTQTGQRMSSFALHAWLTGRRRPTEISWYQIQKFLAGMAQECSR